LCHGVISVGHLSMFVGQRGPSSDAADRVCRLSAVLAWKTRQPARLLDGHSARVFVLMEAPQRHHFRRREPLFVDIYS
jgi:hypothetical protein